MDTERNIEYVCSNTNVAKLVTEFYNHYLQHEDAQPRQITHDSLERQAFNILNHIKMKKFNITNEKLTTIALTCVVWLCVLIAAAFALQEPTNAYIDAFGAIGYLIIAAFFEWIKYKITHNDNTLNTLD